MLPRLNLRKANQPAEEESAALSLHGQAMVEEVDQLAGEVIAPENQEHAPMTRRQAVNMRRVANGFYIVTVALSVLLGLTLLLNTFALSGVLGLRFFVEPTNAMVKQAPRGSLLVTAMRSSDKINAGDVVTYNARYAEPGTRMTRIVAERFRNNGQVFFRTKRAGDAAADSMTVPMTNILGVKLAVLPGVGYVVSFLQSYGWGLAILAATLLISAVTLRRWANMEHPELRRRRKRRRV